MATGVLLLLLAAVPAAIGAYEYSAIRETMRHSIKCVATVTAVQTGTAGNGDTLYTSIFSTTDSTGRTFQATPSSAGKFPEAIGTEATGYYNPASPNSLQIDRLFWMWGPVTICAIIFGMLSVPALICLVLLPYAFRQLDAAISTLSASHPSR